MLNSIVSPAGLRAQANGNSQITIADHEAFIHHSRQEADGRFSTRVEFHGAPGFITEFLSEDWLESKVDACRFVGEHNDEKIIRDLAKAGAK